jgi:hypothetical protein
MSNTTDDEGTYEIIDFEDSDEDTKKKSKKSDDLAGPLIGFLSGTYLKLLFAIFIIFLFISSDVFIDKVLGRIGGATEHKTPTSKGVFIQALVMVTLVMIIDLLLRSGFP